MKRVSRKINRRIKRHQPEGSGWASDSPSQHKRQMSFLEAIRMYAEAPV